MSDWLDELAAFDLTTSQAGRLAGVSRRTVGRLISDNPDVARLVGGRWRVSRTRLLDALRAKDEAVKWGACR